MKENGSIDQTFQNLFSRFNQISKLDSLESVKMILSPKFVQINADAHSAWFYRGKP